jgi:pimeloyl-ACP methyl ester carboxylesterase
MNLRVDAWIRSSSPVIASAPSLAAPAGRAEDAPVEIPETHFARTVDGVNIAYQVVGDGPVDLVYLPAWFSHVEIAWEEPKEAGFLMALASFSRLIVFDRRGTGASDPQPPGSLPPWESYAQDLTAVLDEVGSQQAALLAQAGRPALA